MRAPLLRKGQARSDDLMKLARRTNTWRRHGKTADPKAGG
jgi:hypothetical protein